MSGYIKKSAVFVVICLFSFISIVGANTPQGWSDEFVDSFSWFSKEGFTRYETVEKFRPYDTVTREQGAHFFSMFSENVLLQIMDMGKFCSFDDLDDADITLKNSILSSCLLNLFSGSAGKFYPKQYMTKAQALTVLVRAIDGYRDESGIVWRDNYYEQAYEWGLTTLQDKTLIDVPMTRYEMVLLMKRAETYVASGQNIQGQ